MREKIIETAIVSLQTEGLKFSVDTIASRLRISKKTIYKHFPNKEALASAIYEAYYKRASEQVKEIEDGEHHSALRLIAVYRDAAYMIRSEIFNKFQLNDSIHSYVMRLQDRLWTDIFPRIAPSASQTEEAVLRSMIEGAFEKAAQYHASTDLIAEKLVKVL